jgi:uncharacterized secreted protein with C-terminal beta-propeller domain
MKKVFLAIISALILVLILPHLGFAQTCQPDRLKPVRRGQRNYLVKNLQLCLLEAGYYLPNGATGYYGNQTIKAVRKFYTSWWGEFDGFSVGRAGIAQLKKIITAQKALSTHSDFAFKKFSSTEEFRDYLKQSEQAQLSGGIRKTETLDTGGYFQSVGLGASLNKPAPSRVSETTVQVKGIDEPDIVKTDGQNIYFSKETLRDIIFLEKIPSPEQIRHKPVESGKTNIIKAFPLTELDLKGSIDKNGELLLLKDKKILIVFVGQEIIGYDVANTESPQKKWDVKLEDNTSLVGARLYQDKVYLVTRSYINSDKPCPIQPLSVNGTAASIICPAIYHPNKIIPVDVTFTAFLIEPLTGAVEKNVSFVGSASDSVLYMSPNAIYITYFYQDNYSVLISKFLKEKGTGLLPDAILAKIEKLNDYDISELAKQVEIQYLLEQYQNSLSQDERLKLENEFNNRLTAYYQENKRQLEKTGVVKIGIEDLTITATGVVPGYPLNQFALDEYQNNLRLAITVGERGIPLGFSGRSQSANDIYVLDKDLKVIGSVLDLGLTERIYSVRFIGNRGYVVTFRQTDPFYVLDLSEPTRPQLKGELKIPGYSAYLEPITEDKILGVGQEQSQVKVSLFDVTDAEKPTELDKYLLKDYWSEVLSNHHAFLLDNKHLVFFLPGGQGGYIFSYKNDKLELVKTISDTLVKRAVYIDDYLYVLSRDKIVVFDENNWKKIKELDLR